MITKEVGESPKQQHPKVSASEAVQEHQKTGEFKPKVLTKEKQNQISKEEIEGFKKEAEESVHGTNNKTKTDKGETKKQEIAICRIKNQKAKRQLMKLKRLLH